MEKTKKLFEITSEITDQVKILESIVDQVSILGEQISKLTNDLKENAQESKSLGIFPDIYSVKVHPASAMETQKQVPSAMASSPADEKGFNEGLKEYQGPDFRQIPADNFRNRSSVSEMTASNAANIIPFPGQSSYMTRGDVRAQGNFGAKRILGVPEMQLPHGIPDFRPLLQRDGLILLAWDKRSTEMGERFTAYWVTSTGIPRFYASKHHSHHDFSAAKPDHKSYAAEDGVEFFGQKAPDYLVHVAPELMMSNPRHRELRQAHISILLRQGYNVDYGYDYLLTKEKKRTLLPGKLMGRQSGLTGA